MKIELKCTHCNQLFTTDYKHRDKQFCNRTCYFNYARENKLLGKTKDPNVREERECVQCGINFTERIKYERKLCSNECRENWQLIESNKNNRIDKSKKKLLEKYGVDSIFKLDDFKKN